MPKFLTRNWLKKIARDIFRQKLLNFALILLYFFGIGSYLALTMGYTNLDASFNKIYQETNFADVELFTHTDVWFNISELANISDNFIGNNSEISAINYRLITETGYNITSPKDNYTRQHLPSGRAIGIEWNRSDTDRINDLIFESGNFFNNSSPNNSIIVEAHFARNFQLNTGEFLSTRILGKNYNLTMQGIAYSPEYLIVIPSRHDFFPTNRFGVIYFPIEILQQITGLRGLANNIIIKMQPETPIAIRDSLISNFVMILNDYTEGSFTPPVMQENQVSNWALKLDLEEIKEIALILPIVVLGVAVISLYITIGRMVQSQKRIIGVASCLGYFPNDILLHYIFLTLIIGSIGSFFGVVFGTIVSGAITWVYAYYMGFPAIIEIYLQFYLIVNAFAIGCIISVLGGFFPAYKASRTVPHEALLAHATTKKGTRSLLEKLIPINPFGLRLTIPLRNIFRHKIRFFSTITGIAVAVGILVVSFAFIDSISTGVYRQFNETSRYDLIVKYDGLQFADLGVKEDIAYIENITGVSSVDPVLQMPSILFIDETQQEVLVIAWNTSTPNAHNFQWFSNQDFLGNNGSIVVCTALANNFNIQSDSLISYAYPDIPDLDNAYDASKFLYDMWNQTYVGDEVGARKNALDFLAKRISNSKESFSFSDEAKEVRYKVANITVTGISKEIWGKVVYTNVNTLSENIGIDIFKEDFDIDLTPFSQLILKVDQPTNITLLEEIKDSVSQLERIRGIDFAYDLRHSVDTMMAAFNAVVFVFLVFACLLAGAAIFTAIYLNFQERQREIATMFTIGLSDGEFLFIITVENIIQAIVGIFLGIPFGLWIASWLLDNILRLFYFEIFIQNSTWLLLWVGVIIIVLISQIPAVYKGVKLDLTVVTKEMSS
ncbi:MAG: ABC transporter permease [Candidatus Hodarchaeales archaeon]